MQIVFLDIVHSILQKELEKAGHTCINATDCSREACIEKCKSADGIVIRSRFRMDADFLENVPNLKFIARSGAGMENLDEAYCEANNIVLFNAPEGNRTAVAEHALGMLLALFNKLTIANNEVRNGKWNRESNRGIELTGKTVGIIGFGNNGSEFAKLLSSFDVTILAYDKYKNGFGNEQVQEVSLQTIQENADVISLHIPQTEETVGLIDAAFIQKVKNPFYLINLARGKIVHTNALVNGLQSGEIIGACLDVLEYEKSSFESFFEQELPEDFAYLLQSEKMILSPHVGGWTEESYFKLSNVLAEKVLAYLDTQ